MSWVVKEQHIDSVTCANRIAKILVLLQQQKQKKTLQKCGVYFQLLYQHETSKLLRSRSKTMLL